MAAVTSLLTDTACAIWAAVPVAEPGAGPFSSAVLSGDLDLAGVDKGEADDGKDPSEVKVEGLIMA